MNKTPLLIVIAVALALAGAFGWYKYYDERDAVSVQSRVHEQRADELAADLERASSELQAVRGELSMVTADLNQTRVALARANEALESARGQAAQASDNERARAQAELEAARAEAQAALESARAEAQAELEAARAEAQAALEAARAEAQAALEAARAEAQAARAKAQAALEAARAEAQATLEEERARAQAEVEAERTRAQATLEEARVALEARRRQVESELEAERARAQAQRDVLRSELESAQGEVEQLRTTRDGLLAEITATRRAADARRKQLIQELATAQGSERAARSELERLKRLVARLAEHEQTVARLSEQLHGKDANLTAMEAEMAEIERAAAEERARFESMQREMRQELSERDVELQQLANRLTLIRVGSDIVFRSGSAELTDDGRKTLELVARILQRYPDRSIEVEGHTDNVPIGDALRPIYPSNWELSAARAARAVRFLENAGVDPQRLRVVGYGSQRPEADNDDPVKRGRNRRIQIAVLPDAPFRVQEVRPQ